MCLISITLEIPIIEQQVGSVGSMFLLMLCHDWRLLMKDITTFYMRC
ncbi:hypothetical protein [Candidatus Hodgkinia cicadicola]